MSSVPLENYRFELRIDTAANWTSANPVLAAGEPGIEEAASAGNPAKLKIGDGATAWTSLPYFTGGGVSGSYATSAINTITVTNGSITAIS